MLRPLHHNCLAIVISSYWVLLNNFTLIESFLWHQKSAFRIDRALRQFIGLKQSSPILNYERWAWIWSMFLGSQPTGDLLINLVIGYYYFPPGQRLLSQPKRSLLLTTVILLIFVVGQTNLSSIYYIVVSSTEMYWYWLKHAGGSEDSFEAVGALCCCTITNQTQCHVDRTWAQSNNASLDDGDDDGRGSCGYQTSQRWD